MNNLGIIAGSGVLPIEISKINHQLGGKTFIAGIEGSFTLEQNLEHTIQKNFYIGNCGAILDFFKDNNVKNIIIIGAIDRPNIKAIKVDLVGAKLMASILKNTILGDDKILRIVTNFIEKHGFAVISPQAIIQNANYVQKLKTKKYPSKLQLQDINAAKEILSTLSKHDVGQAIIIENGYILGIEAAEGTDELIARCASLRKEQTGAILVKNAKDTQDLRLDIPTIGPKTINMLTKHKYSGIAVNPHKVIIAQPEQVIIDADANGLFLHFL